MALMLVQREPVPFASRLMQGVCSLSFSIQQACLAYGLYKGVCSLSFSSVSWSSLWFVQGSMFPLHFVQQACLALDLVKGLCSLFLVLLVSSFFFIYTILTFDKKKKRKSWCKKELSAELQLERESRERCSPSF
jgi:hypothetical protein